ncbi:uncharacterized protein LOC143207535 isoform X2 [Lasioglossum baleicum]|uniref:uncharacterized protein LOC143207535 isoform X2 n=1 Tax=Lasioglossum baleicum TaxID=434251 RepID=UPI003FCD56F3
MEKENYRVNKVYCNPIQIQNEHAESIESNDERRVQEEKYCRIRMVNEEKKGNEKKDNEEKYSQHSNTILGLCAICHLAAENMNSTFHQNIPCSEEHILCQHCIQQFTIPSDAGCILCQAQIQRSNLSLSQESDTSLNSIYICPRKMQAPRQQPECHVRYRQSEQAYIKSRNQNYSTPITNTEKTTWGCSNVDDSEDNVHCDRVNNQSNTREERDVNDSKQRQHSYCNLYKKGNPDFYISETKINGQITAECSRRPIRCPRIDCAINVAFSALTHHFVFDHPEVPILNVEPGIKSTLIVSFNALSLNSSRCLALLLVSGKLSLFNSSQINPKFRNRLPLPVLAARLHSTDQCNKINYCEKSIIIAWVAGLDIGNTTEKLLCSIQAVDKFNAEGLRSLTYTGPVNSLRTAQCPREILSTGDCIVLHEGLLRHITSDCATLNVNVTVH